MSQIVVDDPSLPTPVDVGESFALDQMSVLEADPAGALPGWRDRLSRPPSQWPLLAVLLVQSFATLRLQNTVFQDEALYLWAGRVELNGLLHHTPVYGDFSSYFSGAPGLYPVVGSVVEQHFGLAGARALSLVFMLVATTCLFAVTRRLFGDRPANFAAVAFGLSAPALFVGHLATFDSMCLALLAVATWLAVRQSRSGRWAAVPLIGVVLAAAVVTKYAGALFVPSVLAIFVVDTATTRGWRAAWTRLAVVLGAFAAAIAAVLIGFGTAIWRGTQRTTTSRSVSDHTGAWTLIQKFLVLGGLVTALAIIGIVLVAKRQRLLGLVLLGSVLLAPAYHVRIGEPVSFHKHIAFGLFFAAPLAGVALTRLVVERHGHIRGSRFAAAVVVGVAVFALALTQSSRLFHEWPNSDELVTAMRSVVHPDSSRILADVAEVPRYRMQSLVAGWQWNDFYWFEYTDAQGVHRAGADAYRQAVDTQYFDVIALWQSQDNPQARVVRAEIAKAGTYELAASTASPDKPQFDIYRRAKIAGATSTP